MIRIVLVDDHHLVREGLKRILADAADVRVVGEAASAEEALGVLAGLPCDAVVTDLAMPGRGGLELIEDLRRAAPQVAVIVLSVHGEAPIATRALRSGAAAYLPKESAPEQLLTAIRQVGSGRRYVHPDVADRIVAALGDDEKTLSTREFAVLRSLASGRTATETASALGLSIKTVSTYRTRMLRKLDLRTSADLIAYAIRNGLCD